MGAVATAAAGAGATAMTMWAVGCFHDLDKGYQIWSSEEFGRLFWKDDENKSIYRKDNNDNTVSADESQLIIQDGEVEVHRLAKKKGKKIVKARRIRLKTFDRLRIKNHEERGLADVKLEQI